MSALSTTRRGWGAETRNAYVWGGLREGRLTYIAGNVLRPTLACKFRCVASRVKPLLPYSRFYCCRRRLHFCRCCRSHVEHPTFDPAWAQGSLGVRLSDLVAGDIQLALVGNYMFEWSYFPQHCCPGLLAAKQVRRGASVPLCSVLIVCVVLCCVGVLCCCEPRAWRVCWQHGLMQHGGESWHSRVPKLACPLIDCLMVHESWTMVAQYSSPIWLQPLAWAHYRNQLHALCAGGSAFIPSVTCGSELVPSMAPRPSPKRACMHCVLLALCWRVLPPLTPTGRDGLHALCAAAGRSFWWRERPGARKVREAATGTNVLRRKQQQQSVPSKQQQQQPAAGLCQSLPATHLRLSLTALTTPRCLCWGTQTVGCG